MAISSKLITGGNPFAERRSTAASGEPPKEQLEKGSPEGHNVASQNSTFQFVGGQTFNGFQLGGRPLFAQAAPAGGPAAGGSAAAKSGPADPLASFTIKFKPELTYSPEEKQKLIDSFRFNYRVLANVDVLFKQFENQHGPQSPHPVPYFSHVRNEVTGYLHAERQPVDISKKLLTGEFPTTLEKPVPVPQINPGELTVAKALEKGTAEFTTLAERAYHRFEQEFDNEALAQVELILTEYRAVFNATAPMGNDDFPQFETAVQQLLLNAARKQRDGERVFTAFNLEAKIQRGKYNSESPNNAAREELVKIAGSVSRLSLSPAIADYESKRKMRAIYGDTTPVTPPSASDPVKAAAEASAVPPIPAQWPKVYALISSKSDAGIRVIAQECSEKLTTDSSHLKVKTYTFQTAEGDTKQIRISIARKKGVTQWREWNFRFSDAIADISFPPGKEGVVIAQQGSGWIITPYKDQAVLQRWVEKQEEELNVNAQLAVRAAAVNAKEARKAAERQNAARVAAATKALEDKVAATAAAAKVAALTSPASPAVPTSPPAGPPPAAPVPPAPTPTTTPPSAPAQAVPSAPPTTPPPRFTLPDVYALIPMNPDAEGNVEVTMLSCDIVATEDKLDFKKKKFECVVGVATKPYHIVVEATLKQNGWDLKFGYNGNADNPLDPNTKGILFYQEGNRWVATGYQRVGQALAKQEKLGKALTAVAVASIKAVADDAAATKREAIARAEDAVKLARNNFAEAKGFADQANLDVQAILGVYRKVAPKKVTPIGAKARKASGKALNAVNKARRKLTKAENALARAERTKDLKMANDAAEQAEKAADAIRPFVEEAHYYQQEVEGLRGKAVLKATEVQAAKQGHVEDADAALKRAGKATAEIKTVINTAVGRINAALKDANDKAPKATKKLIAETRGFLEKSQAAVNRAVWLMEKVSSAVDRAKGKKRPAEVKRETEEAERLAKEVRAKIEEAKKFTALATSKSSEASAKAKEASDKKLSPSPVIYFAIPTPGRRGRYTPQPAIPHENDPKLWQRDPKEGKMLFTYELGAGRKKARLTLRASQNIDTLDWSPWSYQIGRKKVDVPPETKGLLFILKGSRWYPRPFADTKEIEKILVEEKKLLSHAALPKQSETSYSRLYVKKTKNEDGIVLPDNEVLLVGCPPQKVDGKREYAIMEGDKITGFGSTHLCPEDPDNRNDEPFPALHMTLLQREPVDPEQPEGPQSFGFSDKPIWRAQGVDRTEKRHFAELRTKGPSQVLLYDNHLDLLNQLIEVEGHFTKPPVVHYIRAEISGEEATYTEPALCPADPPKPAKIDKRNRDKRQTSTITCNRPGGEPVKFEAERQFFIEKVDNGTRFRSSEWAATQTFSKNIPGEVYSQNFTIVEINGKFEFFPYDQNNPRIVKELQRLHDIEQEGVNRGRNLIFSGGVVYAPGSEETTTPPTLGEIEGNLPPDVRDAYWRTLKPTVEEEFTHSVMGTLTAQWQPELVEGTGLFLSGNLVGGKVGDEFVLEARLPGIAWEVDDLIDIPFIDASIQAYPFSFRPADVNYKSKDYGFGAKPRIDLCVGANRLFGEEVWKGKTERTFGSRACLTYNPNMSVERYQVDEEGVERNFSNGALMFYLDFFTLGEFRGFRDIQLLKEKPASE